jgi:putative IMPACT (imprinted ancient) family translation regulator
MLNEYDQVVEYSGDDGEPKGTSGKPTLSVLQGHELINAAIITVRYFGGTKLGPGGLVRAYAQAANAAFAAAELITYEKHFRHTIACEYTNISIVEYEALQHKVHIVSKTFDEQGALLVIEAAYADMESFLTGVGRCVNKIE